MESPSAEVGHSSLVICSKKLANFGILAPKTNVWDPEHAALVEGKLNSANVTLLGWWF